MTTRGLGFFVCNFCEICVGILEMHFQFFEGRGGLHTFSHSISLSLSLYLHYFLKMSSPYVSCDKSLRCTLLSAETFLPLDHPPPNISAFAALVVSSKSGWWRVEWGEEGNEASNHWGKYAYKIWHWNLGYGITWTCMCKKKTLEWEWEC
jgi:hypothetical protein